MRSRSYGGGPVQAVVALEMLYLIRDYTEWNTTSSSITIAAPTWLVCTVPVMTR
jgi:hypothetical protein